MGGRTHRDPRTKETKQPPSRWPAHTPTLRSRARWV